MEAAGFTEFYAREHARVLGTLCAVSGDRQSAIEATDEAFVRALERWDRVQAMQSPSGWTYRVALNSLRRAKRRYVFEARVLRRERVTDAVPQTNPELWEAVRSLPRRQAQVIALRFVADLPEAEIATVLGVSRGTVASTLFDARAALAKVMSDDD